MKKTYYIPTIEIVKIESLYPMALGDTSGGGHAGMAPPKRRETGDMGSF